jgi:hypothetical protein
MGDRVRTLNNQGIQKFKEYLSNLRQGSKGAPPAELLKSNSFSAEFKGETEVENRPFRSKLEMAKYLYERLRGLHHPQVDQDVGLWSWLSVYYFDLLCPENNLGKRTPGRDYRYVLDLHFRVYRYHMLLGPYTIYKLHGEGAPLLLHGPLYETSRFYLELSARQAFITNRGIIEAANLLYFDATKGIPKRGAAVTARKPGALIRFIDVVQQLDLTYDLYSMNGEEVVSLLPSEFDEWKPKRRDHTSSS